MYAAFSYQTSALLSPSLILSPASPHTPASAHVAGVADGAVPSTVATGTELTQRLAARGSQSSPLRIIRLEAGDFRIPGGRLVVVWLHTLTYADVC